VCSSGASAAITVSNQPRLAWHVLHCAPQLRSKHFEASRCKQHNRAQPAAGPGGKASPSSAPSRPPGTAEQAGSALCTRTPLVGSCTMGTPLTARPLPAAAGRQVAHAQVSVKLLGAQLMGPG
jgi:hypothetical protein